MKEERNLLLLAVLLLVVVLGSMYYCQLRPFPGLRSPWEQNGIYYQAGQTIKGPALVQELGEEAIWVIPNDLVYEIRVEARTWGFRYEYTESMVFCLGREYRKFWNFIPLPTNFYPQQTLLPDPPEQGD